MHLTQLHRMRTPSRIPIQPKRLRFAHLTAKFQYSNSECRKILDFLAFGDPEKYIFIFWSIETLLILLSDSRRHQLQLRNSTASICIETFQFHFSHQRAPGSFYITPWPFGLLVGQVPCSKPTATAQFPAIILRHQSC